MVVERILGVLLLGILKLGYVRIVEVEEVEDFGQIAVVEECHDFSAGIARNVVSIPVSAPSSDLSTPPSQKLLLWK